MSLHDRALFVCLICGLAAGCSRDERVSSGPTPLNNVEEQFGPPDIDEQTPPPTSTATDNPAIDTGDDEVAVVDEPASTDDTPVAVESSDPPLKAFSGKELPADTPLPEDVQRKLKSYEEGFVADIVELLLTYPQTSVRVQAAGRLGYLSKPEDVERAVAGLRGALRDPQAEVRAAAASRLSSHEAKAKVALGELIVLLDDRNEDVVNSALETIVAIGPDAAPAMPKLKKFLAKDDYTQRSRAISALGNIGPPAKSAVPQLSKFLAEYIHNDTAAYAIAKIGEEGPLLQALKTGGDSQRSAAVQGAKGLKEPSPEMVAALIKACTSDSYEYTRRHAAETLGQVKPSTQEITAVLIKAAGDPEQSVRYAALRALGEVEPKFDEAIPVLVAATKVEDESTRTTATASLGKYQGAADVRLGAMIDSLVAAGRLEPYSTQSEALEQSSGEFYPLLAAIAGDPAAEEARRAIAIHGIIAMLGNDEFATDLKKEEIKKLIEGLTADAEQPITVRAAAACSLSSVDGKFEGAEALWVSGLEQAKLTGTRIRCADIIRYQKIAAGIPALIKALEDPDPQLSAVAIGGVGRFEGDAATAVPVLVKLAGNPKTPDRYNVYGALGDIAAEPKLSIPAFEKALGDEESSVRSAALRGMAKVIAKNDLDASKAVTTILAHLDKAEGYDKTTPLGALQLLGPKAAPAVEKVAALVRHENESVASYAVSTLGTIGPDAKAAVPQIIHAIKTWEDPDVAIQALGQVKHGGAEFAPLVPKLMENLDRRYYVLQALGMLGPDAAASVPEIVKILDSPQSGERTNAIDALVKIGEASKPAMAKLTALAADDEDRWVRRQAAEAMAKISPDDPALAELTLVAVNDLEDYQLERTIKEWGDRAPAIVRGGLTSTSAGARRAAIRVLPKVVADSQKTIPFLEKALDDEDTGVRYAAALHLAELRRGSPKQLQALVDRLGADEDESWQITRAIRASGGDAVGPLVAIIANDEKNDAARRAAVEALEQLRTKQAAPLHAALASKNVATRDWAAIALARTPRGRAAAESQLTAILQDASNPRRLDALRVIPYFTNSGDSISESLASALLDIAADEDERLGEEAARCFSYSPPSDAVRERLVALVEDEKTRARALKFAPSMRQIDERIIPHLLDSAESAEKYQRGQIFYAIANQGDAGRAAVTEYALADDKPAALRAAALWTLSRLAAPDADAQAAFAKLLANDDAELRGAAATALANWGYDWVALEPHLLAALQSESDQRYFVVSAIQKRKDDAGGLVEKLLPLVAAEDQQQRNLALSLLPSIASESPAAADAIIGAMRGSKLRSYELSSMASNLGEIGAAGRTALLTAIVAAKDDEQSRLLAALPHVEWTDNDRPQAVAAARGALKSPSADVQRAAAVALATLDPKAADALPTLIAVIETKPADDEENERSAEIENQKYEAFEALTLLKGEAKSAVPVLIKMLDDERPQHALSALAAIGPDAASATPKIIPLLSSQDSFYNAAEALKAIGPAAKEAAPALIAQLADDERMRSAAPALVAVASPKVALPAIYQHLKHPTLRYTAVEVLGDLGDSGRDAVPVLIKALTVDDIDLQVGAAHALGRLGEAASSAGPVLAKATSSTDDELRRAATSALGAVKADPALAVPILTRLLSDQVARRNAVYAVSHYGKDAAPAVEPLIAMLADTELAHAAAYALGEIGSPAAIEELTRLATTTDEERRYAANSAVDALGEIGPAAKASLPALVELHKSAKEDSQRRNIAAALWKIDPAAAEAAGAEQPPEETDDEEE